MKKWTIEEIEILKDNMESTLNSLKMLLPDKSSDQIVEKIRLLYSNNKWTVEEEQIILDNKKLTIFKLLSLLPNRTYESIRHKRYTLIGKYSDGSTPLRNAWTDEDLEKLRDLKQQGYTNYEIADMLERPLNSVMGKLYTKNLINHKFNKFNRHNWTIDEENFIKEKISQGMDYTEIAEHLGMPKQKVFNKAIHLGFRSKEITTSSQSYKKKFDILNSEVSRLKLELQNQDRVIKSRKLDNMTKELRVYKKLVKHLQKELKNKSGIK